MSRSWWERATGPSLLGWPVVAMYAAIGIVPIVATVPAGDIATRDRLQWLGVAVLAQAGLSLTALIGARLIGSRESIFARIARLVTVAIGGAVRGLVVAVAADTFGLVDPTNVMLRVVNSSLTVLLWMVALAILVDAQREFRRAYREAFERDIAIAARSIHSTDADSVVERIDDQVRRWSAPVRQRIDDIRDRPPDVDASTQVVQDAADAIRDLVTTQLRPLSHRLWFASAGQPPRVRLGPVAVEAVSRGPLLTPFVLAILVAGMIIGSVVRYGPAVAAVSGLALIVVTIGYLLLARADIARTEPRRWNLVSVPLFTITATFVSTQVSAWVLGAGSDLPTILTILVGIPSFALMVAMAGVTISDRQALLDAMADPQAVREAVRRIREREVATYVHNHVKSQLTASAMRMREAALADDQDGVRAAAEVAFDVLSRPLPDAIMLGRQSPRQRLREVTESWLGIADVEVELPDDLSDPVTLLVADVVAEAIANAVRAGGATNLSVMGERHNEQLVLTITDNGTGTTEVGHVEVGQGEVEPGRSSAGIGTAWLDSLVPGQWQRNRTDQGTTLIVELPLRAGVDRAGSVTSGS